MKEATGELNMTLITVSIIGTIFLAITVIVPRVMNNSNNVWGDDSKDSQINFGKTNANSDDE
jgi:hypothetical protein